MSQHSDNTVAKIIEVPTSCRCGGDMGLMLDFGGLSIMLGCACHTWFDASAGRFVRRLDKPARSESDRKLRYFHSQET